MKLNYEIDSKDYEDFVRELHEKLKDFEMSEGVFERIQQRFELENYITDFLTKNISVI